MATVNSPLLEVKTSVADTIGEVSPSSVNIADSPSLADQASNSNEKSGGDGKRNGKGDRKSRRDRLPLPDPLPTVPVKRYPEPSRAELQEKIDAHDKIITECFEKLDTSRSFFEQRSKIREDGKAELDTARKEATQLNEKCRTLFESRKSLSAQIKAIRDADLAAKNNAGSNSSAGGKDANEALKGLKTVQDVDDRIAQLEYEQQTASMSILEEKKLIAQIAFLKHTGRQFVLGKDQSFKDEMAAKEARLEKRKHLEELRKQEDAKIDNAKAELEAQKKLVDGIRAKQDAEIQKLAESSANIDRDAIKEQINSEKATIRKLRDEFNKALDDWHLNERIHIEQQRMYRRQKREALAAEREARRLAWEAEQAQYPEPDPYQKEKDMCNGLSVYLQTLLGETVEKAGVGSLREKSGPAPVLKANGNSVSRSITSTGKAIGKSKKSLDEFESLAFSDFMHKKGKSKNKKGKRSSASGSADKLVSVGDSDAPLKPHSIDLLAAFTHLGVAPPSKFSEVRQALEAVKEKKAYYDSDPAPPKEETVTDKSSTKQDSEKVSGKTRANGVDGDLSAFPDLSSKTDSGVKAVDPVNASASSRPSFIDIAKGAAVSPAPPIVVASEVPVLSSGGVDVNVDGEVSGIDNAEADLSIPRQVAGLMES